MKRITIAILLGSILLAGLAHAQPFSVLELEMVEWPNPTNVIMTNLEGTGDQFSLRARLMSDLPIIPDSIYLRWNWYTDDFRSCQDNPGDLGPSSGPDADGWYYWTDIRLPAGSVRWDGPNANPIFVVHAWTSGFPYVAADPDGTPVRVSSPDMAGLDGVVNLSDLNAFTTLQGNPHLFNWAADLNGDGLLNLSDIARLTPHIGDSCGGNKSAGISEEEIQELLFGQDSEDVTFDSIKSMYR